MTLTVNTVNKFSAWHSRLGCCISIPGLATKYSVVQKISSGQTFTNILTLCCDLDLECSNAIFPQDTPAYGVYYQIKFGCKQTNSLEDIVKKIVIFWLCKPLLIAVTLALKIVDQFFNRTHCLMIIQHYTKLGKKKNGCAVQEILSRHDQTLRQDYRQTDRRTKWF